MPFDPNDAVRNPHATNPLKSGLYSIRDFVRKGQEKEYANTLINLMTELSPEGVLEETFATEIFKSIWRLRRCRNVEFDLAESSEQDPMIADQTAPHQKTVDRARAQSHYLLRRSISELTKLQTIRLQFEARNVEEKESKRQEKAGKKDPGSFCNPAPVPTTPSQTQDQRSTGSYCNPPVGQVSDPPASNPEAGSFCKSDESHKPELASYCKTTQSTPQMRNRDQVIGSKTPRNAPCPCNSGAKFKKCCGNQLNPEAMTPGSSERNSVRDRKPTVTEALDKAA